MLQDSLVQPTLLSLSPFIHILLLSLDAFSHQFLFCRLLFMPQDPNITSSVKLPFLLPILSWCHRLVHTHSILCKKSGIEFISKDKKLNNPHPSENGKQMMLD